MPHWRIVALCLPLALLLPAFARSVRAAEEATPSFYRGININGSSVVIDGRGWDGADAQGYVNKDRPFENQRVELSPATDADRARMIRSSTYTPNGQNKVLLNGIPAGTYSVWLYVWEDNDSQSYDLFLNGQRVESGHKSGSAGTWQRLGPWVANIDNGKIELTSRGGHANFSGIEIWTGAVKQQIDPVADTGPPVDALPAEHLRFFESKIRPVLVERCYKCHSSGAKSIEGGLLLDSRLGVLKGGDRGRAIEPGDADASLLVQAIRYEDDDLQMPPDEKLSAAVIADFEQWIGLGAPDPRTAASVITKVEVDLEKARGHWSFQPVREPAVPQVADKRWPLTPVDHFILAKLEANGLRPVEIADRRALVRRATIDLIGLPPTPEEVDEFVNDPASLDEAFRHVVERLLASRHYGERWGRHWMDLVRYADTAGDNSDYPVPQLYLYRNYVIQSFNADKPYDQFLREQIAGDLLSAESPEQQNEQTIATGYIALSRRFGSIIDGYPQHLTIEDTIENLGRTVLGLAISCARCHDHKFDPISQADYYGLYGIFNSTRYPFPGIELDKKPRDFVSLEKTASSPGGLAYAVAEGKTGDARLHRRGDPKNPGDAVPRKFLDVLGGQRLSEDVAKTSGRLQLAHWLTDPANPLTARVMVNRIWQYHFGRGLVETPSDFGTRGLPPTHPELLDYLAARFVKDSWSIKNMHRLIMQSRTYKLSSVESWPPDAEARSADLIGQCRQIDPDNELHWRQNRRRVDAESLRDAVMAISGTLDLSMPNEPHPFPPADKWQYTQHHPFKDDYESNRRSVYLMTKRLNALPYFVTFDGADRNASTPTRDSSVTSVQALFMLNDQFVHEQAEQFAERLLRDAEDDDSRLNRAFLLALGRVPTDSERSTATSFLAEMDEKLKGSGIADDQRKAGAWAGLARVLFRTNEFMYID